MDTERFGREVGSRLRRARDTLEWSLADAKAESGGRWSESALGSWERADRPLRAETFAGLAELYGVDAHEVLSAAWVAAGGQARQQQATRRAA